MATPRSKIVAETRIKRFLYLCSEDSHFVTGNPEVYKCFSTEKTKAVTELLQDNKIQTILNIIEIVNSENSLPRKTPLFFVLAVLARNDLIQSNPNLICQVYTVVRNIIKTSEDLFSFVKFFTLQKKSFPSGLNKLIRDYYTKKEPLDLAKEVSKCNGFHSWTHKDLFKLSHIKAGDDKVLNIILMYVLFGLEKAELEAEKNSESEAVLSHLKKIHELKKCKDESRIAEIITNFECSLTQIPSNFHKSQLIWETLLPKIHLKTLISSLPKLYKLGFLKANTTFQTKVVEIFTNGDRVKTNKLHPVEVFIGLKNFEKGGKPLDPQFLDHMEKKAEQMKAEDPNYKKPELTSDAPKCPIVISAIHKALQISFYNLQSMGKRIMITFDTTDKMNDSCLHSKNLSCYDAAAIMTLCYLRSEKDVVTACFNDNEPVDILPFERNTTLNQMLTKLKSSNCKFIMLSSAFEWALSKKKMIDVFINFCHSPRSFKGLSKEVKDKEKSVSAFHNYRKKMSLPNTKLITFSLSSHRSMVALNIPNTMDICGFSEEVPKIVEAFCKGLFH